MATSSEQLKGNSNALGKSETIKELADKHLHDPNHTTSDEEIINARVELSNNHMDLTGNLSSIDNDTLIPAIPGEPTIEESEDVQDDQGSTPPNPYSVLR